MSLETAIRDRLAGPDFDARQRSLSRADQLTCCYAQAALFEIVQALAPADILEIGTYFGATARILAQAVAESGGGSLITIDPFGAERVPPIIAAWPEHLQAVTCFRPEFSMQYFASLEVSHAPTGKDASFNLVFVDGHHSYEYAYFDLLSAALNLRPGGVIVVDNLDLAGVAKAVADFLALSTHWKLLQAEGWNSSRGAATSIPDSPCAILLAPVGVEIGPRPWKTTLRDLPQNTVRLIEVPLVGGGGGRLTISANLHHFPFDLHLTGQGAVGQVQTQTVEVPAGAGAVAVPFDLAITPLAPGSTHLELEATFVAHSATNLLLDVDREILLSA